MADGTLRLEASADFRRAENEIVKLNKKLEQQGKILGKLQGEHGAVEKKSVRGLDSIARRAVQVALAYGGIHQAVSLVNSALADELRLREKSKNINMTFGQAVQELQLQTMSLSDEQLEDYKQRVLATLTDVGLTPTQAIQVAIPAFSATMDTDPQMRADNAVSALEDLGAAMKQKLADLPELAGAIQDLNRALGSAVSQKEAIGFAGQALSVTRTEKIENLPNIIKTVAAAIAVLQIPDEQKLLVGQEATALMSAMEALTSETVGATTSTAITNFLAEMRIASGREGPTPPSMLKQLLMTNEDLLDVMKFKGKSGLRLLQPEFLRERSDLASAAEESLGAMQIDLMQGYEKLVRRNAGILDQHVAASQGMAEANARLELELLQDTGSSLTDVVLKQSETTKRGIFNAPTRFARNFFLKNAFDEEGAAFREARELVRLEAIRPRSGVDLRVRNRINQFATGAGFGRISNEELLSMQGGARFEDAQKTLSSLIQIVESRERQQELRDQIESTKRTKDNAELKDTVGKTINGAVQVQRRGSQQENP